MNALRAHLAIFVPLDEVVKRIALACFEPPVSLRHDIGLEVAQHIRPAARRRIDRPPPEAIDLAPFRVQPPVVLRKRRDRRPQRRKNLAGGLPRISRHYDRKAHHHRQRCATVLCVRRHVVGRQYRLRLLQLRRVGLFREVHHGHGRDHLGELGSRRIFLVVFDRPKILGRDRRVRTEQFLKAQCPVRLARFDPERGRETLRPQIFFHRRRRERRIVGVVDEARLRIDDLRHGIEW